MRELLGGLLDLVLPAICAACGRARGPAPALCSDCRGALPRTAAAVSAPAPLEACSAAADFQGDVEVWIHAFKYPQPGLAGLDPAPLAVLRMLILEAAEAAPGPDPDLVVPVPLHPKRLRGRGFNPAAVLGRSLARARGADFDPVALRRIRDTPSQTSLSRRERRANVRGAFRARRGLSAARIWLVDDVVTTGSTLAEAARALRRAGASAVVGVCAARTPGPH